MMRDGGMQEDWEIQAKDVRDKSSKKELLNHHRWVKSIVMK